MNTQSPSRVRQLFDQGLPAFLILLGSWICFIPKTYGATLYADVGVGMSQIRSAQELFPSLSTGPTFGLAANFGLFINISSYNAPLQVHLGLKHTYTTSMNQDMQASLQIPYGVLRFDLARFYVGIGLSPFVWTRYARGLGINTIELNTGYLAVLAEFGTLWRVTDFFHLAIEASAQTLSSAAGLTAKPAGAITFQMRFFIVEPSKSGGSSRKYDGWRYPFGIRI